VMSDREKYKRAVKSDIAYNMMRMWQGAVGVAPEDGLVSPAYVVARPYPEVEPRYFSYQFRTDAYKNEVDGFSRGIVKDRNRLYWEDFKRMPSCFPPLDEQQAIADYLDANAIKVRRFIRNRRRLIEVLNEQKQAIINRAVTRGLDPDAPLKPSGIDWLGDIPEHWDVRRLRNVAELRVSNVDKHTKEGEFPVRLCNYTDVYKNSVITADMPFMAATATRDEIEAFRLHVGDVIITKDSEDWQDIGVPALLAEAADDLVCGYHLAILRPRLNVVMGRFLSYALQCREVVAQLSLAANGVTRYGLSHGAIKAISLPMPPADQQEPIAEYIDDATASLNEAIGRAKREIDLIHEYRTRLIADVVTGKLDVRQTAVTAAAQKTKKPANVHFRRSVFAAEIVHRLHDEPTFGHVKFEKLIFLCEKRCRVDTGSTYHRQAAGPYDNRALRSIDKQIKEQQWYEAQKRDKGYRYVPLDKAGDHRQYFDRYFAEVAAPFDEIINMFRSAKTYQCEIVATLYSAWEDMLGQGNVTDDQIIEQVLHHWHPSKRKVDEATWRTALGWMREKRITPEDRHEEALNH